MFLDLRQTTPMNFYSLLTGAFLLLSSISPSIAADYVGRDKCQSCHATEYQSWKSSHHDLAMDHANSKTVLGDFTNTSFKYAGGH